jgi:hypothetical protein
MKTVETTLGKAAMFLGTAMIIAWSILLGLTGAVLLLMLFHAMTAHLDAYMILLTFVLFTPLLMTLAWSCVSVAEQAMKRLDTRHGVKDTSWWEHRRGFRILYQAYYG